MLSEHLHILLSVTLQCLLKVESYLHEQKQRPHDSQLNKYHDEIRILPALFTCSPLTNAVAVQAPPSMQPSTTDTTLITLAAAR